MIQRTQIEQVLRLNGLSASAPDEEIKSVLLSARWRRDDIETAILVLRENTQNHKTHVDTLHKIFHTDQKLDANAISALLGIEMNVSANQRRITTRKNVQRKLSINNMLFMVMISLVLSLLFVFGAIWYLHMGLSYSLQ